MLPPDSRGIAPEELRGLLDKQAISEVLYRYARGWDRRDLATILACFRDDATHQHGSFTGASHELIRHWFDLTNTVKSMTHLISNILIELNGDVAVSESHFFAHHRRAANEHSGERDWFIKGRYLDRFERRAGAWQITHRTGLEDFERLVEPAEESHRTAPPEHRGRPLPTDPLYRMLEQLRTRPQR